jgi:hypothetical protein
MEARHVQLVGHGNVLMDQQLGEHDVKIEGRIRHRKKELQSDTYFKKK